METLVGGLRYHGCLTAGYSGYFSYNMRTMKMDELKRYREKRDFGASPEPAGGNERNAGAPVFVVQKHDARRLHYDFRIEAEGVLKSWAVPKGPSLNPRDRRLAVMTEDHPLDYAGFEGVIPEGQYGAGAVILWDRGAYRNITEKDGEIMPMETCLEKGHVAIWLEGEKLRGGFALIRTGGDKNWLLIKKKDECAYASRDVLTEKPESVVSGKTIEEVAGEK